MPILRTRRRYRHSLWLTAVVYLTLTGFGGFGAPIRVLAATVTANTFTDPPPGLCSTTGTGNCSLREAVIYANSNSGTTIQLLAGTYLLTIGPSGADDATTGDLNLTMDMTITGAGANQTTIDASGMTPGRDSVFSIHGHYLPENIGFVGPAVTISGVTISGGFPGQSGSGGAIRASLAYLTLQDSVIQGNTSSPGASSIGCSSCILDGVTVRNNIGAGIQLDGSGGTLLLTRATVSNNSDRGVAVSPSSTGGARIIDTTISNNAVAGIDIFDYISGRNPGGNTSVTGSTISGPASPSDASGAVGIRANGGAVSVTNSTISGFQGPNEAGIDLLSSYGSWLTNVTLAANRYGLLINPNGVAMGSVPPVQIEGTILASDSLNCATNSGGSYVAAPITAASLDYNLSSDASCSSLTKPHDLINTNPKLGPLANNDGPTQTHALLPGSPAIDAGGGSNNGCPDTDQRGVTRPVGPACDIGAYEFQVATIPMANPIPMAHPTAPSTSGDGSIPAPMAMLHPTAPATSGGGSIPTPTPLPQPVTAGMQQNMPAPMAMPDPTAQGTPGDRSVPKPLTPLPQPIRH